MKDVQEGDMFIVFILGVVLASFFCFVVSMHLRIHQATGEACRCQIEEGSDASVQKESTDVMITALTN